MRPDRHGTLPAAHDVEFDVVATELTREHHPGHDGGALALGLAIHRVSNALVQESERRIHRPRGWSWRGFHIMYTIRLFGDIEARDLTRLAGVSRQSMSSALANLENKGYVDREHTTGTDRRLVTITLTPTGTAAIDDALARQNALETEWFGCLRTDERAQLETLLDRVAQRVGGNRQQRAPTRTATAATVLARTSRPT